MEAFGNLSAGGEYMGYRKYVSDYRLDKQLTGSGRVKTTAVYKGDWFTYRESPEAIRRLAWLVLGIALAVYYLSFGIFYDSETILLQRFGKKDVIYYYKDIVGQKLYLIQGGNIVIELHMADGSAVSLQSSMDGVYLFLDTAFAGWCLQKGIDPVGVSLDDGINDRPDHQIANNKNTGKHQNRYSAPFQPAVE